LIPYLDIPIMIEQLHAAEIAIPRKPMQTIRPRRISLISCSPRTTPSMSLHHTKKAQADAKADAAFDKYCRDQESVALGSKVAALTNLPVDTSLSVIQAEKRKHTGAARKYGIMEKAVRAAKRQKKNKVVTIPLKKIFLFLFRILTFEQYIPISC